MGGGLLDLISFDVRYDFEILLESFTKLCKIKLESQNNISLKYRYKSAKINSIAIPIDIRLDQIISFTITNEIGKKIIPFDKIIETSPKIIKNHKYTRIKFADHLISDNDYDVNLLQTDYCFDVMIDSTEIFDYKLYVYLFNIFEPRHAIF